MKFLIVHEDFCDGFMEMLRAFSEEARCPIVISDDADFFHALLTRDNLVAVSPQLAVEHRWALLARPKKEKLIGPTNRLVVIGRGDMVRGLSFYPSVDLNEIATLRAVLGGLLI